jgi:hypothetical protein
MDGRGDARGRAVARDFRDRLRAATLDNAAAFSADGFDYREYGNAFRRNDVDP